MSDNPGVTNRWQFSIRSMLMVTALVAVFLAGMRAEDPVLVLASLALVSLWRGVVAWHRGGKRVDACVRGAALTGTLIGCLVMVVGVLHAIASGAGGPSDLPSWIAALWLGLFLGGGAGAILGMVVGTVVGLLFGVVAACFMVTWEMVEYLQGRGSHGRHDRDNDNQGGPSTQDAGAR